MTVSKASDITAKLLEPFPAEVIEEKNGLLYIPHEIIRDRLISATENQFDWSIDQILFRDDGVTRRANDRYTGEPKRPLSMIVIGTLTIPGLGSRAGIGAHPLDEGAGEDAAYKSAESDAVKRAAMAFGVGLHQLYIETGEAKRVQKPQRNGGQVRAMARPATDSRTQPRQSELKPPTTSSSAPTSVRRWPAGTQPHSASWSTMPTITSAAGSPWSRRQSRPRPSIGSSARSSARASKATS